MSSKKRSNKCVLTPKCLKLPPNSQAPPSNVTYTLVITGSVLFRDAFNRHDFSVKWVSIDVKFGCTCFTRVLVYNFTWLTHSWLAYRAWLLPGSKVFLCGILVERFLLMLSYYHSNSWLKLFLKLANARWVWTNVINNDKQSC